MKKIALIGTRGLPASYGAFEQTIDQISFFYKDKLFYVCCEFSLKKKYYDRKNVIRFFFPRLDGMGVILFQLYSVFYSLIHGCKTFFFFGYSVSFIFPLLKMLRINVICNVDGIEWRRSKWKNRFINKYLRFSEKMCVISGINLIFDSKVIARYYQMNHKIKGKLIYYGSEIIKSKSNFQENDYLTVVMRMEEENNILLIVKAFLRSTCNYNLYLIGPNTKFFNKYVLPLVNKNKNKIKFLGGIYDRDKLINYRLNSIVYIHGHSVGGTNPTLVEACKIGRPIISYNSFFNKEILGDKAKYFKNETELSEILSQDITTLKKPPRLGRAFDWDYIANQYFEL